MGLVPSVTIVLKMLQSCEKPVAAAVTGARRLAGNWLQVFRRADATLLGSDRRRPHQTRAMR